MITTNGKEIYFLVTRNILYTRNISKLQEKGSGVTVKKKTGNFFFQNFDIFSGFFPNKCILSSLY